MKTHEDQEFASNKAGILDRSFIPSQYILGSNKEIYIIKFEGIILEISRTSNVNQPIIIRLNGEVLTQVPSGEKKEIEFQSNAGKHILKVWTAHTKILFLTNIFFKKGVALTIDDVPVQSSIADPTIKLNEGRIGLWLFFFILLLKGFIAPLLLNKNESYLNSLNSIMLYLIPAFILGYFVFTFNNNPKRASYIGLVIGILETLDFCFSSYLNQNYTATTFIFLSLRMSGLYAIFRTINTIRKLTYIDPEKEEIAPKKIVLRKKNIIKNYANKILQIVQAKKKIIAYSGLIILLLVPGYFLTKYLYEESKKPKLERNTSIKYKTELKLPYLIPYRDGDKWGYCNSQKKIIIEPKYKRLDLVENKSNHLIVNYNGQYGVIDSLGNKIIPFIYDYITNYPKQKVFVVSKNDKTGLIDYNFNVIIPTVYYSLKCLDEFIIATPFNHEKLYSGLSGYDGKSILGFKEVILDKFFESEKLFLASILRKIETYNFTEKKIYQFLSGLADYKGNIILPMLFAEISNPFNNKYFVVAKYDNTYSLDEDTFRYGVLNIYGEVVIPFEYDRIFFTGCSYSSPYTGAFRFPPVHSTNVKYLIACRKGNWGVIDLANNVIIPFKNSHCTLVKIGDLNFFTTKSGKFYGLFDDLGEIIIPFNEYFRLEIDTVSNLITANKNGKYGVIDFNNKIIIPFKYDKEVEFRDGYAAVSDRDQSYVDSVLNSKGQCDTNLVYTLYEKYYDYLLEKGEFYLNNYFSTFEIFKNNFMDPDSRRNFYREHEEFLVHYLDKKPYFIRTDIFEDFALMVLGAHYKVPSKSGFINNKGEVVIDLIYDSAENFINELAIVEYTTKFGVINKKNQVVIPIKYDRINKVDGYDLYKIKLNKKEGYVDINGVEYFND